MIAQEEYKLHADFQAAVWKREPREIQLDFFFLFQISNFLPSLKCARLPIKLKHMKKISQNALVKQRIVVIIVANGVINSFFYMLQTLKFCCC